MGRLGRSLAAVLVASSCAGPRTLPNVVREVGPPRTTGAHTVIPISFTPLRGEQPVIAERGWVRVPVRRDRPTSDSLTIHYVRLPARTPRPSSPIVYVAGGPGGSGTASAADDRYPLFDSLRDVADVIALDQRGTWNTDTYSVCPGSWSFPNDRALTPESLAEAAGPWVRECHRYWTAEGVDLDGFNTRESAADLEALRVALGAERLSLLAISYGTHLALEFIRSFPTSVDRVVLAGVEGPDHTLKSPARVEATLRRIDAYFESRGMEPLTPRAREAIDRLHDTTRSVNLREAPVTFGQLDAQRTIFAGAGERADLIALSDGIDASLGGDDRPAASAILEWRKGARQLAMSLAMNCASWASAERLQAIEREARASFLGDAANTLVRAQCASWPGRRLGDGFHAPVRSSAPTLFISGGLDVRTPLENALEVAEGFSRAWHLLIPDGGHDDDLLIASPRLGAAIRAFLSGADPVESRREIRIG